MTDYNVKYTDASKAPINIAENSVNNSSTDITLFGRKKLEYGRDMNANFLHILENFACPEVLDEFGVPYGSGLPDTAKASFLGETTVKLLSDPTEGQLWYNTTQETIFVYDGVAWIALGMSGDIAANWGVLHHGENLPRPINQQGYVFGYDECAWIVSPFAINTPFRRMECRTDVTTNGSGQITESKVYMVYLTNQPLDPFKAGCVNYMIVGIKGNVNMGDQAPIPPPTPEVSMTASVTPTPTRAPSPTPPPSATSAPGVTSTRTPTPTPTRAPSSTPVPTVGSTATPTPTAAVTNSPAPNASPTPVPTSTPNYGVQISANPSGGVAAGQNICYTVTINTPAPAGGYSFVLHRKRTNYDQVCASVNDPNQISGVVVDQIPASIPAGQNSVQICRTAPVPPAPTPTPTATPRTACVRLYSDTTTFNGGWCAGFLCRTSPGGTHNTFTNSSGGNGNYNQCTAFCACNNATGTYTSSQTIPLNPVRVSTQLYDATPAVHINGEVSIPGVGIGTFGGYVMASSSTASSSNTRTFTAWIGTRSFTVTLNITATLVGVSGQNRTWSIATNYSVWDNELGVAVSVCSS